MTIKVLTTPTFVRIAKKLHAKDKKILDEAIGKVIAHPDIGEEKKGDLAGVFVYKFKLNKHEILLAYRLQPAKFNPQEIVLLTFGSYEHFYANLKN